MPGGMDNQVFGYIAFSGIKFLGYSLFASIIRNRYLRISSADVLLDDEGRIASDYGCRACGYNVRTLRVQQRCPECSVQIESNLVHAGVPSPNCYVVGFTRMVIGNLVGAAYGLAAGGMLTSGAMLIGLLAGLVPVRIMEWWLLLWVFFDRRLSRRAVGWRLAVQGMFVSFALDIPALLGMCVLGGVWIC